ncbi:MAG: hypothetical protein PHD97_11390 [Bacteroidales bacterium]|nr:hypothetical protein [Bacteroidales bacterium]
MNKTFSILTLLLIVLFFSCTEKANKPCFCSNEDGKIIKRKQTDSINPKKIFSFKNGQRIIFCDIQPFICSEKYLFELTPNNSCFEMFFDVEYNLSNDTLFQTFWTSIPLGEKITSIDIPIYRIIYYTNKDSIYFKEECNPQIPKLTKSEIDTVLKRHDKLIEIYKMQVKNVSPDSLYASEWTSGNLIDSVMSISSELLAASLSGSKTADLYLKNIYDNFKGLDNAGTGELMSISNLINDIYKNKCNCRKVKN